MNRRPVLIDLNPFHLFLPALVSILHRISGILILFLIPVLLWLLQTSLGSELQFEALKEKMHHPLLLAVLGMSLAALLFHLLAGIRHMLMDLHIAETRQWGRIGAMTVLILFAGIFLWLGWILCAMFVLPQV